MGLSNGTVGWADVAVPDMAAGIAFYEALFGWETQVFEAESMPYAMFSRGDKAVAGLGSLSPEQIESGQPPAWSTYIIVDDADTTFAKAVELGATPLMEPMDIPDTGRFFFVLDPVGAAVGFWQSGDHDGAEVFNEMNTMTWNDTASSDLEASVSFYTELLGWVAEHVDYDGFPYTLFKIGERSNAGAYDMSGLVPDGVPPHWLVWFLVEDCHSSASTITELGGSVLSEPRESGVGTSAVVADPFGATFAIIEPGRATDGQPPR